MRQALGELPDDEPEIMRLSHFEGRSHAQIAEILGEYPTLTLILELEGTGPESSGDPVLEARLLDAEG